MARFAFRSLLDPARRTHEKYYRQRRGDAIAAVVNELVAQHTSMNERIERWDR